MMKRRSESENSKSGWIISRLPLLYAFPVALAMIFAALRWGDEFKKLIHVVIKLVVKA